MDVYVLVDCERHTDPQPMVFARKDVAIAVAESTATAYAEGRGGLELDTFLNEGMKKDGWVYYAAWGDEGDFLFVSKRPVNGFGYGR